jgi:hypothetical protein
LRSYDSTEENTDVSTNESTPPIRTMGYTGRQGPNPRPPYDQTELEEMRRKLAEYVEAEKADKKAMQTGTRRRRNLSATMGE